MRNRWFVAGICVCDCFCYSSSGVAIQSTNTLKNTRKYQEVSVKLGGVCVSNGIYHPFYQNLALNIIFNRDLCQSGVINRNMACFIPEWVEAVKTNRVG